MDRVKNKSLLHKSSFINGTWVKGDGRTSFNVTNPANGAPLMSVENATEADVHLAIASAEKAFPSFRSLPAKSRAILLRKWYDLIIENIDDLALILSLEQGKPLAEARGEILYGASYVEWFSEEARRIYGDIIPAASSDKRILTLKQPIGVVAAITPWNFPSAMITRKVAPALAVGCTVIIKPSEETPLSALALAELAKQAGFPEGVLNVIVTKDAAMAGDIFCQSSVIRKLSFTGSTAVGKILMRKSADTVKKLSMELGGNAPFIVFDDADLDAAVKGAIASKYRNAGQTCVCANRIFVQEGVYDAFAEKLKIEVERLNVGSFDTKDVAIGPLINKAAIEKVTRIIADATGKGAKILLGGEPHALGHHFHQPTILTNVTRDMACFSEEIFGPVAPLYKFSSEEEVIKLANDTPYGLASYFYARDIGRIWRVSEALEYGMVGINEGIISSEAAPFGGVKESGNGREGSKYGTDDYLEIKYLCMGGLT
ncbi:MAG: NAD-dependent succinate-semialdehyde dehydrogenase [Emcibacter sp.]|nr:NAD-dependent succinate-semialdehyde dehydrogenase [Emcibacter sp.]